jgi:hypothetical protein
MIENYLLTDDAEYELEAGNHIRYTPMIVFDGK